MTAIRCDICIIGAGSGGLSVAAGAAQLGARVVLIEAAEMGGDCLNSGCVPSKALLAAAAAAEAQRRGFAGVAPQMPQVDFAAVKDHVAATIAAIAPHDGQDRFEAMGCTVIRAWARFIGPDMVQAGPQKVQARRFVIATGSRPALPPIEGLEGVPYLTNETIFALRSAPAHLLVLGGGPIGLEMAQAHRRLGCAVTVIEAGRALGREDVELVAPLLRALRDEGVTVLEGQAVARVEGAEGALRAVLADGRRVNGSHLLIAAGRRAELGDLGLETAGVAFDTRGVLVDAHLRSVSNRRVYAVGDAAGQGQFTHLAGYHAGLVVRQAVLGLPARARGHHIPRVTYTEPELAQVGLTEVEARTLHGSAIQVIRSDLAQNDRARAAGQTGLLKLIVLRGKPIGVSILGPSAGELIAPWALAMAARLRLSAPAGMILPYPTLSEVSKRAAGAYFAAKLFGNPWIRRLVRGVQRWLP